MCSVVNRDGVCHLIALVITTVGHPVGAGDDDGATSRGIHPMVNHHLVIGTFFVNGETKIHQIGYQSSCRMFGKDIGIAGIEGQCCSTAVDDWRHAVVNADGMDHLITHIFTSIHNRIVTRNHLRTGGCTRICRHCHYQFIVLRTIVTEGKTDRLQISSCFRHSRCVIFSASVQFRRHRRNRHLGSHLVVNHDSLECGSTDISACIAHIVASCYHNRAASRRIRHTTHNKIAVWHTFVDEVHICSLKLLLRHHFCRCIRHCATHYMDRVTEGHHHRCHRVSHMEPVRATRIALVAVHNAYGYRIGAVAHIRIERYRSCQAVIRADNGTFPRDVIGFKTTKDLGGHLLRALIGTEQCQNRIHRHRRNRR